MEDQLSVAQGTALIDLLGGNSAVSTECGVTSQGVSWWRVKGIPRPWCKFLQLRFPEQYAAATAHPPANHPDQQETRDAA